jgi:hypothetical protein
MTEINPNPPSTPYPAPPPPPPPVAFGPAAVPVAPSAAGKNPGAAGVLGIIPGLGHLYLGLYQRGAILFGIWVLLISLAGHSRMHGPFPGILIPFWMVFSIIDAVQQARAINMTGAPMPGILGEEKPIRVSGSLTVGVLLVLIGGLSFLNDWWPALLVLFGAWQIFSYWKSKQPKQEPPA